MPSLDSFISDDEEELCPLCVEEMDLSDKNFKPCPCGYQVCQFCYNNIRQNPQLNGRCPACRRPYDDETVEYKMISQEEWKQDHLRQARKERERKQREREKKETEQQQSSKKHLSGMRVIQKNLVYVIGLNPNIPTEELHNTLRGDQFFGQYGKIQKIVINRRNNANGNPGLGVYVTFARKEDAAKCIAAVDGSINDGKYLRAAYGTTKYCSSYLRGQPCPNPNCMFLHEPGEEADSYTRQDLSTIQHAARGGSGSTGTANSGPGSSGSGPGSASSGPTSGPASAVAAAAVASSGVAASPAPAQRVMSRSSTRLVDSNHGEDDKEAPALPASVSWAHKASPPSVASKLHIGKSGGDVSAPGTAPASPSTSATVTAASGTANASSSGAGSADSVPSHLLPQPEPQQIDPAIKIINENLECLSNKSSFSFVFSSNILSEDDLNNSLPPFFSFSKTAVSKEPAAIDTGKFASLFASFNKTGGLGANKGYNLLSLAETDEQLLQSQPRQPPTQPQSQSQQPPTQQPGQGQLGPQYSNEVPVAAATPPPGLFSGQQPIQNHMQPTQNNQNSQELLAHLMNGGSKGEN
ncbi:CCR4-NOT core ubiquitin-protein ligase subunit MOT2 [Sugiyamaella lignohabitans]|uniref:CCR4-NOT core ubiquitin-protein ligase subunit MOT2 n=1 Tax=Sugiyamaella lignohabitans TaxID=796027 RepID=A0A167DBS7_9ASCO|nr:CCR4-NOT core ubiquitin-protein ligase subunit MOT2 [Sugiyamaella lignohabitans]ANB12730.1 CCR4-NOT core ubiquitin-protein ligase subunit MOT2 [Sugiyamaella lignohabitans]